MSINFEDNPSLDEILAEYPTDIYGVVEVIGFIEKAVDGGIVALDETGESVDSMVEGFRLGIALFSDLPEEFTTGTAGAIIHATRYFVDVADAARAAGRKVTLRAIGLAIADLGIALTKRDAEAGNAEAQEAIEEAGRRGLL